MTNEAGFQNLFHRPASLHPGIAIMDDYVAGELYARLIVEAWNPARGRTVTVLAANAFDLLAEQGIYRSAEPDQEESLNRMTRKELYTEIDQAYDADDESRLHAAVAQLARMSLPTEDAAQEAAIAVWQSLDSHDPAKSCHAWVNGVIRHFRRPAIAEQSEARMHVEFADAISEPAGDHERLYEHTAVEIDDPFILQVIDSLRQGYNLSEIAKQQKMRANTVQQRVWRYSAAQQRRQRDKSKKVAA